MSKLTDFLFPGRNRPSPVKTKSLTLLQHRPQDLVALLTGEREYEKSANTRIAGGVREFLLAASPDFVAQLRTATAPDPWQFGFAIVQTRENFVIGMCGFTGPPSLDGEAEIAYSIAPAYQRRGYATEAAAALVDYAQRSGRVTTVLAHTLPESNASTRVLEKCGFRKIGEILDPENTVVWRWERTPRKTSDSA